MEKVVEIGISNRHVHLTKEVYEVLFDEPLELDINLNQPGEFASKQRLSILYGDNEIKNVRVLGPFRKYNQIEISRRDSLKLGVNPPVRESGNLEGASLITLKTPKASVTLRACIIAQRHVHMSKEKAAELGVVDKQKIKVRVDGEKSGVMHAYVKVSDNGYFEFHIDTDDACAFLLDKDAKGTIIL